MRNPSHQNNLRKVHISNSAQDYLNSIEWLAKKSEICDFLQSLHTSSFSNTHNPFVGNDWKTRLENQVGKGVKGIERWKKVPTDNLPSWVNISALDLLASLEKYIAQDFAGKRLEFLDQGISDPFSDRGKDICWAVRNNLAQSGTPIYRLSMVLRWKDGSLFKKKQTISDIFIIHSSSAVKHSQSLSPLIHAGSSPHVCSSDQGRLITDCTSSLFSSPMTQTSTLKDWEIKTWARKFEVNRPKSKGEWRRGMTNRFTGRKEGNWSGIKG
jgi:hypothetical protein